MRVNLRDVVRWLFLPTMSSILVLASNNVMAAVTFIVYIWAMWGYLNRAKENAYMIIFMIAFFVFLLGQPFALEYLDITEGYGYGKRLTDDAENTMYISLSLSLLSLYIGYCYFSKIKIRKNSNRMKPPLSDNLRVYSVQRITRYSTIFLYIIVLIVNLEMAAYVAVVGYLASYVGRVSMLPSFFSTLADIAPVSLALYLATLPRKDDARPVLILYGISEGISLLTGRRYEAVAACLFLVLYCILRSRIDEKAWITKRHICLMVATVPFVMLLLISIESWRVGGGVSENWQELLGKFFTSIGGSSNLIGYVDMYSSQLKEREVFFSFGNIWRSLNGNAIAQFLFDTPVYTGHTVEAAMYGRSLGSALMYYINPTRFLSGGGLGSCFIAELYIDFSYLGVAIGSMVLGMFIAKLKDLHKESVLQNFVCVFAVVSLIRMPRDSFDYCLNQFIALKNVLFYCVVYLLSDVLMKKVEVTSR